MLTMWISKDTTVEPQIWLSFRKPQNEGRCGLLYISIIKRTKRSILQSRHVIQLNSKIFPANGGAGWGAHWNYFSDPFSFHRKWMTKCTAPEFCALGGFSLTTFLYGTPDEDTTPAAHF